MHTIKVLAAGFALLAACLVFGRSLGNRAQAWSSVPRCSFRCGSSGAAINMWIGVSRAGYSVADEAPVFLMVFGIPAAVALLVIWRTARGA